MINAVVLIFTGGAIGAMAREFLMLGVPHLSDGFPLSIFVANVVASFLLGLATGLHQRRVITDDVHTMVGTGILGGLSTFSSFVYGSLVVMTSDAIVAFAYILASLVVGFGAVSAGFRIGARGFSRSRGPVQ